MEVKDTRTQHDTSPGVLADRGSRCGMLRLVTTATPHGVLPSGAVIRPWPGEPALARRAQPVRR
jgi:hypothetical protein